MSSPASPSEERVRIPLEEIRAAAARIAGVARRTPLEESVSLSRRTGASVYLKLECWQRTRSFKIRGAYNAVTALSPRDRQRGLAAASAGNHGMGVALAARESGASARIFVPADAPETKRARIASYGAELVLVDGGYDEAELRAAEWARETDAHYVHAYDDASIVAGQGTIGLEILDDLPDVATVLVPVGGGGLVAGIGAALRGTGSRARIIGVQSEATRAMHAAFAAGGLVPLEFGPTLADGLSGAVSEISYRRAVDVCDDLLLVTETEVRDSIAWLFRHEGVVAEGSGAVGVAALLAGRVQATGPIVVVVSGGNIDAGKLAAILTEI